MCKDVIAVLRRGGSLPARPSLRGELYEGHRIPSKIGIKEPVRRKYVAERDIPCGVCVRRQLVLQDVRERTRSTEGAARELNVKVIERQEQRSRFGRGVLDRPRFDRRERRMP
jgi:hypothetical protein